MVINTTDFTITAKADKVANNVSLTANDMNIIIKKGDVTLEYAADGSKDFQIGTIDAVNRKVQIIGTVKYTTVNPTRDNNNYIEVAYTQAYKKLIE